MINRGDRLEPIFKEDGDRSLFLVTLGECRRKSGWEVHAYCLMPDHFHLVAQTPRGNPVAGMKWFPGTYTARFNRRHELFGHLFGGRHKSLLVDGSGNGYLKTACDHVRLNPARARLIEPQEPLRAFCRSSYRYCPSAPSKRPEWLRVDRLMGEHGIGKDGAAGRRPFETEMEERRPSEELEEYRPIRRGRCYGEAAFRAELLDRMQGRATEHHYAEDRRQSDERKALGIVATECQRLGWSSEELKRRRKGDPDKARIARRLRTETTMSLKWIAEQLHTGVWTHVSNLLSEHRRSKS